MCDTLMADLVDVAIEAEEAIEEARLIGIEADKKYQYSDQALVLVQDFKLKQIAKIDQPKVIKQPEILSGKALAEDNTDSITGTLKGIFQTL